MRFSIASIAFSLLVPATARAQAQPPAPPEPTTLSATQGFGTPASVVETAPIFLLPDASRLPLRVARVGSQVRVLQRTGDWSNVQFDDPQYGLRTGYMQSRYLSVEPPAGREPAEAAAPRTRTQVAQAARSESAGFYVGGGFEALGIMPDDNTLSSQTETGKGAGIVAGYGFSPLWSLYGSIGLASMNAKTFSGTYRLTDVNVGMRAHFAQPERTVVPFLEVAISRRAVSQDYTVAGASHSLSASGPGVTFGGGINVHIKPAIAVSAGVTWTVGSFSTYDVDDRPATGSFGATSSRLHVGVVLFPKGNRPRSAN